MLSAEELADTLLGTDLVGFVEGQERRWRECIAPDGTTRFAVEGERLDQGRLRITDDGRACFTYASRGYEGWSCWWAERDGADVRFHSDAGGAAVFRATQMSRVRSCAHLGAGV